MSELVLIKKNELPLGLYKLAKKSTPNYYPNLFIYSDRVMSQKAKAAKKIEEEQSSIDEEIAQIHDKKQVSDQIYYLVVFKPSSQTTEPRKQWRSQTHLKLNPTFHKAYMKYQLLANKSKVKLDNLKSINVQQKMSVEKDEKCQTKAMEEKVVGMMKKIHIDKEKMKLTVEKREQQQQQQMLLDKFVGKIQAKQVEGNQASGKAQESQSTISQFKTTIKPDTPILNTKQKPQQQPKQEQKPLSSNTTEPTKPQTPKVNPMWLEKIKSVNKIKGYEIRNGQIVYEIEASDRNGQNFFLPPMPTDVVMKYDAVKLAGFLQDCLLRGYAESAKTKLS